MRMAAALIASAVAAGGLGALIFTTVDCTGCHSGAAPSGGLDMSTMAAFEANTINVNAGECTTGKKYVNPGSSGSSYIVDKLLGAAQDGGCFSGNRMPNGGPFLTPFQISQIAQWIDDGAPL